MSVLEKCKQKNDSTIDFNNNVCQNRTLLSGNLSNNNESFLNNKDIGIVSETIEERKHVQVKNHSSKVTPKIEPNDSIKVTQAIIQINNSSFDKNIESVWKVPQTNSNIPSNTNIRGLLNFQEVQNNNTISANINNVFPINNSNTSTCHVNSSGNNSINNATPKSSNQRIKRPMNAFMVWSREKRKIVADTSPQLHNAEISRMLGNDWRNMSEADKHPYYEEAKMLQEQHHVTYPDYKYKPRRRKNNNQLISASHDVDQSRHMKSLQNSTQHYNFMPCTTKAMNQPYANHIYSLQNPSFPLKSYNYNSIIPLDGSSKQNYLTNINMTSQSNVSNLSSVQSSNNKSFMNSSNNFQFSAANEIMDFGSPNPYNLIRQPLMNSERATSQSDRTILDGNRSNISGSPNHENNNSETFDSEINSLMCNGGNPQHYFSGASNPSWILNSMDKIPYSNEESSYPNGNIARSALYHNPFYFQAPFIPQFNGDRWIVMNENMDQFSNFNNTYRADGVQIGNFIGGSSTQSNNPNYQSSYNYPLGNQNSGEGKLPSNNN